MFSTKMNQSGSLYKFSAIVGVILFLLANYIDLSIRNGPISKDKEHSTSIVNPEKRSKAVLYLGLIFFISGTLLWDNKIQRPQDKILKIQVELAEIELETARINLKTARRLDLE
jgi:hypothetical protein